MRISTSKTPSSYAIPVFKLYGETRSWPTPDFLHIESIESRSRLHKWEIQAHQHSDLVQLLYLRSGHAVVEIEGVEQPIVSTTLQVVPSLCVHGFRFSEDVDGDILTLALPFVQQVMTGALTSPAFSCSTRIKVSDQRTYIDQLFDSINREYLGHMTGRETMLQSLISMLLVWIARQAENHSGLDVAPQDKNRVLLQNFIKLIEQKYREHWTVAKYARALGNSPANLNSICRKLGDQSALQIINQRVLLEAKRLLVYTAMTGTQISSDLGFAEPGYFSRFFKRETGLTPQAFRRSAER